MPVFIGGGVRADFREMTCHPHGNDYLLLAETPAMHASPSVALFIEQEIARPSKQWITNIIDGKQESDEVIRRTGSYVLLPDTERVNRYWRTSGNSAPRSSNSRPYHRKVLNWLAIALDKRIHTLRDLHGGHLRMLKDMLHDSMQAIEAETGIRANQVMAYVHYPPSVYQLHVHFSYPYGQFCHRDAYRVHNLASVINNLEIDPCYYAKATLHMAVLPQSLHCAALLEARDDSNNTTKKNDARSDAAPRFDASPPA
jgi:hypothetical protein